MLVDFFQRGGCRFYQTGGGGRTQSPKGASRVGLYGRGVAKSGGGGRRSKHWSPGAGHPRYATARMIDLTGFYIQWASTTGTNHRPRIVASSAKIIDKGEKVDNKLTNRNQLISGEE